MVDYQWYPGHMTKAVRAMREDMKLIDLVIEITDARIPLSSRNPDIDSLASGKARIMVLGKADLADPDVNRQWKDYFEANGTYVISGDARNKTIARQMMPLIEKACEKKRERDRARGILNRPVRAMVCGIPNVGKSTLINSMAGRASAKTGNKPGVTRGKQWIRLKGQVELLDTPGLLWPKFEDPKVGLHLAMIGSIRDEILESEKLACELLALLGERYPGCVQERYRIAPDDGALPMPSLLERIALATGCLLKGEEPDTGRCARRVIDDFRKGKFGKISLEIPTFTN